MIKIDTKSKIWNIYSFLLMLFIILPFSYSTTDETYMQGTSEDAHVQSGYDTTNYGDYYQLYVGESTNPGTNYMRSYVEYNLPNMDTITNAVFYGEVANSDSLTVNVYWVNDSNYDFDESTITWNIGQPCGKVEGNAPNSTCVNIGTINVSSYGWTTINVTTAVQQALQDVSSKRFVLVFDNHQLSSGYASFYSNDYGYDEEPYLNLTYFDTTAPTITVDSPINDTYTANVWFNVTVNENADWCGYSLDNANNITMDGSGIDWYKQNSSMAEGYHTVKFYCNDSSGNMNSSIPTIGFTVDTTFPIFSDYKKDKIPNEDQNVQINITISETSNPVILELTDTTNYTIPTYFGLEYYFTILSGNYTAHDVVTYYWFATDLAGNLNRSVQQSFTIVNRVPIVTQPTVNNTTPYTNDHLLCNNGVFSDDDNEDTEQDRQYKWYDGNNEISSETNQNLLLSVVGLDKNDIISCSNRVYDGYEWSMWQNSSNSATIQNSAPVITTTQTTVSWSTNGTSYTYDYNFTDADSDSMTWSDNTTLFNINSATGEISDTPVESDAGIYHIRITANDGTDQDTDDFIYTITDTTKPIITTNSPQNTTYGDLVWFNITLSEVGDWCSYSLDNAANQTLSNSSGNWNNLNSSMADGSHNVIFYCNDTVGNMNSTPILYFNVDLETPTFSGYVQNPDPPHENENVQINVTLSEIPDVIILEWMETINYTVTTNNSLEYYFTINSGNYTAHDTVNYYWYANDSTSNLGKSAQQSFTVANQAPIITVTEPNGASDATSSTYTITWSASDNDAEDTVTISCYADLDASGHDKTYTCFEDTNNDGTQSCDMSAWSSNDYYIWCNITDTYTGTTDYSSGQVTVDNTAPSISNEVNTSVPHEDATIQINATITDSQSSLSTVWIEVTVIGTPNNYTVNNHVGNEYYITLTAGNYTAHDSVTWQYFANDTFGNENNGALKSFTVANQIPTAPTTLTVTDNLNVTNTLTASGSGSTDSDTEDNPLTYYYEIYNINDSSTVQTYSTDTTYIIQVSDAHDKLKVRTKAWDGYVYSSAKEVNRSILDTIPTDPNDINGFPAHTYVGTNLPMTASGGTDADNDVITYHFKFYNVDDSSIVQDWSADNSYVVQVSDAHNTIRIYAKSTTSFANSTGSYYEDVGVENSVPTIPSTLTLTDPIHVVDELTAIGSGSSDADNDGITYYYEFYNVNDAATKQSYSTDNTYIIQVSDAHDKIRVRTKTYDGYTFSGEKETNRTVTNTVPTTPSTLTLTNPIYITDTLTATGSGSSDADSDSITYYYEFYNVDDSNTIQGYSTDNTYVIQSSDIHNKIRVKAKAYDGYDYSSEKENNRTVSDSIPTIPSSIILNDSTLYTNDHVLCTASGSTDADSDVITYYYKFNKTGHTFQDWSLDNTFSCTDANCNKNNILYCFAKATTNLANSTVDNTSTTILNTLPTSASSWTDLGIRLTDHTPSTAWTEGSDVDGDAITTYVYVGTTSTPTNEETHTTNEVADLGNTITLNDATTYYYRLRTYDGQDYSASYTASDEFHMNGLPTTSTPSIVPAIIHSTEPEIMCQNGSITDPENDVTTLHYEWYKNDIPLSLNYKNITNTNYTAGDVMICEIWISDPYETNTTKLNSSSVTIEGYTPSINWNYTYLDDNSIDMTPSYNQTIKFNTNITDGDDDLEGVYFTLLSPNGTYIYNTINGTNYNSNLWNSTLIHTIDSYGSWMVNITANDSLGLASSEQWNFTVNLGTLTFLPEDKSYSQKAGQTESFNVTFEHDGNSNNTINMTLYDDLANSSLFTIDFYEAVSDTNITNTNFTVLENINYILKVNITSDITLASDIYTGNITFERVEDNNKQNLTISITISALSGNVIVTPETWSISMDSASSSYSTFKVENDGDYDLTHCNGSISTWSSYDSYNNTDFNVTQGNYTNILVTVSNVPASSYSKELVFTCISTPNNGIDTDATTISATISQYTAPEPPSGGGGGGSDVPESECGDGVCQWDETWNESDISKTYCPQDCLVMDGNISLIFDVKPSSYTVITRSNTAIKHNFKIENYNPEDYVMWVYVTCQSEEDRSCEWIMLDADGVLSKELHVTIPGGNEDQPGAKLIDYVINVPSDTILNIHRLNIVVTNTTYGYKAVYPVTMDMRFGSLTWLYLQISKLWNMFIGLGKDNLIPFAEDRDILWQDGLYGWHLYVLIILILVAYSIYRIDKYSKKYRKNKGKKYFDIDLNKVGM